MYKKLFMILLVTQSLALVGCNQSNQSWLRDRAQDYKVAKPCPDLVIPQGTPAETFSDTYDIPMD